MGRKVYLRLHEWLIFVVNVGKYTIVPWIRHGSLSCAVMLDGSTLVSHHVEGKVVEIYHYLQGVLAHPRWLFGICSINSING